MHPAIAAERRRRAGAWMDAQGLADLFYEAALAPDLWPAALSIMARRFDGSCAILVASGPDEARYATSTDDGHIVADYVSGGWAARSDRIARCARLDPKAFVTERHLYTLDELHRDPALEGFFLPRNIGSEFGTIFSMPTGDLMVATVQRRFGAPPLDAGAVATAEALRPHLARAALISARLGLDRSRGAVDALATLGFPAAALSARGRVVIGNDLLASLMPHALRESRGRLTLSDPGADLALSRALEELRAQDGGSRLGRSIPIAARLGGLPSVAHLVPVMGAGRDVFVGAACVVMITRASTPTPLDAGLLASLFGLTPAEARVARSAVILGGVPAVADELKLSRETVKSQLKAVMGKTGVASQQGLTALLGSLTAGAPVDRGG
ncbi:hypothetical protein D3273_13075 [Lichenibacterium minor]|uniref:HTH luxR-type domain-containing protein n=1 Tax=Lichenibacterium minor TaxID=2316528 RepID=A0A4Q2U8Z5_9HYPH|nr:hypothetical protein [Lichenibacterium minor]RYC31567.1 hypothetical protein D3273_13075 [Lichenibacterium minor]